MHIASICININFRLYSISIRQRTILQSIHTAIFWLLLVFINLIFKSSFMQKLSNCCYNEMNLTFIKMNQVQSISFWWNLIFFHLFIEYLYTFKLYFFKIVNTKRPPLLANCIKLKNNINSKYSLRSADIPSVVVPYRLQCCIMETPNVRIIFLEIL